MAGRLIDAPGRRGFICTFRGKITTIDGLDGSNWTAPCKINSAGMIAGTYSDNMRAQHSFLRASVGEGYDSDDAGTLLSGRRERS
jgi:hypothetical protein